MGRPKHLLELDGKTFLQHCLDALTPIVDEIVVSVGPKQPAIEGLPADVKIAVDRSSFEGPLAGMAAGLAEIKSEFAVVVSCDAPLVHPGLVEFLFDTIGNKDICLSRTDREQFFPGIYRTPVGVTAAELLARGERRLGALLDSHPAQWVDVAKVREFDPLLKSFVDVDTPERMAELSPMTKDH